MPGTLYLVATPIGNLEDITHRAVRILGEVDLIACEDTRQTRKLLERYGIRGPLISLHEHNEAIRASELIEKLSAGGRVALVSDAGMPLVSDPGFPLVRAAVERGIPVVPVPGPSAVLAALAASGLPADSFWFAGFLPAKTAERRRLLERIRDAGATAIVFEAPHRILRSLGEIREILGDRPVVAARELTKIHEEFLRGTAAGIRETLAARGTVKGEFTLVIGRGSQSAAGEHSPEGIRAEVLALVADGLSRMEAIKAVARARQLVKREVYRILQNEPDA